MVHADTTAAAGLAPASIHPATAKQSGRDERFIDDETDSLVRAVRRLDLMLFHTDPAVVKEAEQAGVAGFIVDWERRGKAQRQAGQGTQINQDTLADLVRVRESTTALVLCRINGFGPWTRRDVDRAVDAGADEILLPMVRTAHAVDVVLGWVADRCQVGILIETQDAVQQAADLARRPLSRVYVGLNDLRIDRRSTQLFEPLIDGTVEQLREAVGRIPFGVAGLTLPDRGSPVPSTLLAAELVRIDADFTFLRRSFLADTAGRPLRPAISAIHLHLGELAAREPSARQADQLTLAQALGRHVDRPA